MLVECILNSLYSSFGYALEFAFLVKLASGRKIILSEFLSQHTNEGADDITIVDTLADLPSADWQFLNGVLVETDNRDQLTENSSIEGCKACDAWHPFSISKPARCARRST